MRADRERAGARWLALREPADADARSRDLVARVRSSGPGADCWTIHDLGCGTGSMARWLAGELPGPQHWIGYDRDAELLAVAAANPPREAADGAPVSWETRRCDITRLTPADLAGATLVTASALLDVLTQVELQRLVGACATAGCPVLITLSVTGEVELTPSDAFDVVAADAFNAHQRRTVGAGALLGSDAVGAAVDGFTRLGFDMVTQPSPWRLGPDRAGLAQTWFTGWLAAAVEQRPELGAATRGYARRRRAEMAAGGLSVVVQHRDLLARLR